MKGNNRLITSITINKCILGSWKMGTWRLLHPFGSSKTAYRLIGQCFLRRMMKWNITTAERWTNYSIRVEDIIIMKDSSCSMRTILLIIHSITGSSALYFKGSSCYLGFLEIFWSLLSYFGLDQCTHLPTVRHVSSSYFNYKYD